MLFLTLISPVKNTTKQLLLTKFQDRKYLIISILPTYRCDCVDKSLRACKTYTEHEPICNYVTEKICTTHYKGVCKTETIYVDEPYEDEKCINEEHEKCEKRWITVDHSKVCEFELNTCGKLKQRLNHLNRKKFKQNFQKSILIAYCDNIIFSFIGMGK